MRSYIDNQVFEPIFLSGANQMRNQNLTNRKGFIKKVL